MITIKDLDPDQRAAATAIGPETMAIAGPGSGKTRTLVTRIQWLIQEKQVSASRIIAITFTQAGAQEINERLISAAKLDGVPVEVNWTVSTNETKIRARLGHCGTLHSFALRCLREFGTGMGYGKRTAIIAPESAKDILESKARTFGSKTAIADLLQLKGEMGLKEAPLRRSVDETVIGSYFEELRHAGIVDFDAILTEFLHLLRDQTAASMIGQCFDWLHVDEVQDSAPIDWAIYRALKIPHKFYVGDDAQSIYGFRGAAVSEMLAEARAPGMVLVKLQNNYRSKEEICAAANALIRHNPGRLDKQTLSTRGKGGRVRFPVRATIPAHEGEEIGQVASCCKQLIQQGVKPEEIAVLARTNAIVLSFRRTFEACGLPVVKRGASGIPRDWAYARALVEVLEDPENETLAFIFATALAQKKGGAPGSAKAQAHEQRKQAATRGTSLNKAFLQLPTGVTASKLLEISQHLLPSREAQALIVELIKGGADSLSDLALSMANPPIKEISVPGIEITTVHGAKGMEWEHVFVVAMEDEGWPGTRRTTNVEEERRLAYVAITRAKDALYLWCAETRVFHFGQRDTVLTRTPSRFLREMGW